MACSTAGQPMRDDELDEHRGASNIRPNLCLQIEDALLRVSCVPGDQLKKILIDRSRPRDSDDGNANALLEDRTGRTRRRARRTTSDICMMSDVAAEEANLAFMVDRRDDRNVRKVTAAGKIGVVADERVAWRHGRERNSGEDSFDRADHGSEMDRDVIRLRDQTAPRIEQGSRAVSTFLDVRGEG